MGRTRTAGGAETEGNGKKPCSAIIASARREMGRKPVTRQIRGRHGFLYQWGLAIVSARIRGERCMRSQRGNLLATGESQPSRARTQGWRGYSGRWAFCHWPLRAAAFPAAPTSGASAQTGRESEAYNRGAIDFRQQAAARVDPSCHMTLRHQSVIFQAGPTDCLNHAPSGSAQV